MSSSRLRAIAGLSLAWGLGWRLIDPLIGLAGTAVIGSWAWGLLRATGRVLVDAVPDAKRIERAVRDRLEPNGDRMTDFHLWQGRAGPSGLGYCFAGIRRTVLALILSSRLSGISGLSHVTIEVEACPGDHPHLSQAA